MAAPGWVRIADAKSNGGEIVTVGYVNLRQASGLGVHEQNGQRVIKARFPDGSERTLDEVFADDAEAFVALTELMNRVPI